MKIDKQKKYYSVKTQKESVLDVTENTVMGIANTFFWIDNDMDMLIPGVTIKTLKDNGVNSNANAKIKHIADHKLDTEHIVGKFTVLDERIINNKNVLYFESEIPETTKGKDHLQNYKSGLYDQHSIGFQYVNYILAHKNSENEIERLNWQTYYPLALNPKTADENGFFWVVKEIKLYEISVVMFGSNSLTQYLGSKSNNKNSLKTDLINRLTEFSDSLKIENSKEELKNIKLQILQQQQIIKEIDFEKEPVKCTVNKSQKKTTPKQIDYNQILINNLK